MSHALLRRVFRRGRRKESTFGAKKEEKEPVDVTTAPYREAVGSLIYLSVATRPDITFAVNLVNRYLEEPKKIHWKAVKRILKYLKGTTNHGLRFSCNIEKELLAYSDADYAGDRERPDDQQLDMC